ncbi:MAG: 50S ribosomal protein L18 [Patescibacteria group bacterium]
MRGIYLKNLKKIRRQNRNRANIFGTNEKPRLSVFRSNKYAYAQLISDSDNKTLVSASTHELKSGKKTKTDQARMLGELLAEKAQKAGISKVIFNRGSYKYHGRIKAIAEGARSKGLIF